VEISSIDKLMKKGFPMLTIVPDMKKHIQDNFDGAEYVTIRGHVLSTGLVMVLDSISPLAESFRRLQSNVSYSQPDNPLKTIIVTSANKSEGKSTVSTNLCVALAEAGKRVYWWIVISEDQKYIVILVGNRSRVYGYSLW
jgi:hypothetical protein